MNKEIKQGLARNWFKLLQDIICNDIEKIEKNKVKFKSKIWHRNKFKEEGGGESKVLKNGKIFEKVGVNFSEVYGKFSKKIKKNLLQVTGKETKRKMKEVENIEFLKMEKYLKKLE